MRKIKKTFSKKGKFVLRTNVKHTLNLEFNGYVDGEIEVLLKNDVGYNEEIIITDVSVISLQKTLLPAVMKYYKVVDGQALSANVKRFLLAKLGKIVSYTKSLGGLLTENYKSYNCHYHLEVVSEPIYTYNKKSTTVENIFR